MSAPRKATATSPFGAGKRESHDASGFYSRFAAPLVDDDSQINRPASIDTIYCKDARDMDEVAPSSVALVVTSPPYFAGKEYEAALGQGHIPATYVDYLEMLAGVFEQCVEVLEPGGRIAVNVANLGRKPYRSLSSDVMGILQDRLGLLLRGEIVWHKSKGAAGSCAWGSWQSPSNPVIRDLTERVIVASKGRFDRARSRKQRALGGWPSESSISKDEFMEATTDVWEIPPESASRVGHPAPFPVGLPLRLIELYTYNDDLVLDPFMGSGSTAVAAVRSGRRYVGYETDDAYVKAAATRVEAERRRLGDRAGGDRYRVAPAVGDAPLPHESHVAAVRAGRSAEDIARALVEDCGFTDVIAPERFDAGLEMAFSARDTTGRRWFFDVCGGFASSRSGLRRADVLWKALGKAAVLGCLSKPPNPLVLLTPELPPRGSSGDAALRATRGKTYTDALELLAPLAHARLRRYAKSGGDGAPVGELLSPEGA
ncbi:MAG: site-specific DNA-methyltransferase [Actinobacteria bacterium]|nr:site-specific DNA-methyltransferase [Actinomycetota bacterium]